MRISEKSLKNILSFQKDIPVAIGKLANSFNLEVYRVDDMKDDISGAIVNENGKYVIYTNENEPIVRRRFTIAHELAHYLLHKNFIDDDLDGNLTDAKNGIMYRSKLSNIYEQEANQLASEILIPVRKLRYYLIDKKINNIKELSNVFQVSKHAMQIRLRQGGNIFIKE